MTDYPKGCTCRIHMGDCPIHDREHTYAVQLTYDEVCVLRYGMSFDPPQMPYSALSALKSAREKLRELERRVTPLQPWFVPVPWCGARGWRLAGGVDETKRADVERATGDTGAHPSPRQSPSPAERPHAHEWGPWQDDVAGAVRECACGETDLRPEG